jgi:5-methylcytosine-specific restriction enzyme A
MPRRAARPCAVPGCPNIATHGSYCDDHEAERQATIDARRASPASRGYGRNWRRLRGMYLRRHPYCEDPFGVHDEPVQATQVDHIIPLRAGGTNKFDNLQALCTSCHSRKTVMSDGGFGREGGSKSL